MTFINDSDNNINERSELIKILKENEIDFSFNYSPERYLSRSITQTRLKKYIECPSCYFSKTKKDTDSSEEIMLSNTIHFLADYLIRNQNHFPNSRAVLDFINFSDGNFLEYLKTEEENENYDLLRYLYEIKDPETLSRILKGALITFGTSKRLGFQEVRKNDSISLNLKNKSNHASLTLFTKPDYTGRHSTLYPRSGRIYDNFLIDYKLNFNQETKTNSLQMAFYFLTHVLSNRKIHNYFVLDVTSGNLYQMQNINLNHLLQIINKFLILKNLNYRGKNNLHSCEQNQNSIQQNFLDNLDIENYGDSFGSRTYNELIFELKKLEESLRFSNLGPIVKAEELEKIFLSYPIKIDSKPKD